ncbi:MAG: gluconokinase [Opitutaceae bacterium]
MTDPVVIVVMGVSGSGKTTVGALLARELGWSFRDADQFHPPENVARMSAGVPLTDEDRAPWLAAIRRYIDECLERLRPAVVTCSALRENYRRTIAADPEHVKFVFLRGDYALILERLRERTGHFMKAPMLRSQFDALEPPTGVFTADAAETPEAIVGQIRREFAV